MLASLAAGCGGTTAKPSPSHSSGTPRATGTSATSSPVTTSYCDAQDTTIPGAAAALADQGAQPTNLNAVQQAWFDMDATMVPACSEIKPDPPQVTTKNLTNGALSDADFQTWVTEDEEWWTLVGWAEKHDQPDFITYLQDGGGDTLTTFVRAGGTVVASQTCEYASKYDAVAVTGQQMSALTDNTQTNPGVVYVGAAVGPCTDTWTAADGTVTDKGLGQGVEARELDVTETETSPALGQFLVMSAMWDAGDNPIADTIMEQTGI
jgi:hypothetical protein